MQSRFPGCVPEGQVAGAIGYDMRIGPTEIVEAARHRAPMWDAGSGVGEDRGCRDHAKASCSSRRSEYGLGGGVANWGVAQVTAGGGGSIILD